MTTKSVNRISERIAGVAPSATLAIDAKAKSMKAAGDPVIGFGAGEPDFPTPPHVVDAAAKACRDPKNHKYTPANGLPELKEAIVAKTLRDSGVEVKPSNVIVTNGGKHAVYQSLMTMLGEGDECIVPAPYWTTYPECVRLAGGIPVEIMSQESNGFRVTVDQLESVKTSRTKAIILCSPSNPTGSVYSESELVALGEWCLANNVLILTDEIYEHLVYGGASFNSIVKVFPEISNNCVIVNGVAKTYAMTGWRLGWMIAPADITEAAANLQSQLCSNVNNVAQRATIAALSGSQECVEEMRLAYDRRRQTIVKMLNEIEGVTCREPEGAFYAFANLSGVLNRSYGGVKLTSSMEFASKLLDQAKVAIVPGEAFGAPGFARFSYALSDDDLVEGINRLAMFIGTAS